MIKHGPSKADGDEGLDEEIVGGTITGEPMIKGPNYTPDPTGRRTGEAPNQQVAQGEHNNNYLQYENLYCSFASTFWKYRINNATSFSSAEYYYY